MHIMCIHMAMAVMRITLNIVLCFYPTAPLLVKPILQKQPLAETGTEIPCDGAGGIR